MPKGMLAARWDARLGVYVEAKYPEDVLKDLSDDDLLTIFSTHALSEASGILSMNIQRFSIISYYTGKAAEKGGSEYIVALILEENENPDWFEESLIEIAKMVINAIGRPDFDELFIDYFAGASKIKELSNEQRFSFIFKDKISSYLLNLLREGPVSKKEMTKWISKELKEKISDVDEYLSHLQKANLIAVLEVSEYQGVRSDYVFLLSDIALVRVPHAYTLTLLKTDQTNPGFRENYQKAVDSVFKNYAYNEEESETLIDIISNPGNYEILKILRDGYVKREVLASKIGKGIGDLDNNLVKLAEKKIIFIIKDQYNVYWIFLLSDIQGINIYPNYLVESVYKKWTDGMLSNEVALKHLELLKSHYISALAPKIK